MNKHQYIIATFRYESTDNLKVILLRSIILLRCEVIMLVAVNVSKIISNCGVHLPPTKFNTGISGASTSNSYRNIHCFRVVSEPSTAVKYCHAWKCSPSKRRALDMGL